MVEDFIIVFVVVPGAAAAVAIFMRHRCGGRPRAFLRTGFAITAIPFALILLACLLHLVVGTSSSGHRSSSEDWSYPVGVVFQILTSAMLGSCIGVFIATVKFWFLPLRERVDLEGVVGDFWRLGLLFACAVSALVDVLLIIVSTFIVMGGW